MSEPWTDALVRKAKDGDERSFETLVRRIYPRLRRWALVRAGGEDEADEVVQETLVRAYRSLGEFREEARFSTWLYRIARNVWLDLERSRRARNRRDDALGREREMQPGRGSRPDEALMEDEVAGLVRRFFRELPVRQREVFDLVDLQGYQPTEAAGMMEVSASTARVHLHRARKAIRRAILEHHPDLAREYRR